MPNFLKVAQGVDVMPMLIEVQRQPELWNRNPCRLSRFGPHHETQDMFLRYKDESENIASGDWSNFGDEHIPTWNKTIDHLPTARRLVFDLMARVGGEMLGGVFLYKIQPGKRIHKHTDEGWHATFYDKFNICLQSNDKAAFCYDNDGFVQRPGDVHWFTNTVDHWVVNEGDCDHVVLTVCIRLDRGARVPWSPPDWTMDKSLGRE